MKSIPAAVCFLGPGVYFNLYTTIKKYFMYKKTLRALVLCSVCCTGICRAQNLSLIPMPGHLEQGEGSFVITRSTVITAPKSRYASEAFQLNRILAEGLGKKLRISHSTAHHAIRLVYDASITAPEAYQLKISPSGLTISAGSSAGIFHAVETIRQLLPADIEKHTIHQKLVLPALTINDAPAYSWRGLHLDVARHFFSIAYLRKLIDVMALYKMNKLHLHLTDDQGWRIQIKKYPKLTEEGAWRTFDKNDSACMRRAKDNPDFAIDQEHIIHRGGKTLYGGFYTAEQMKGLVAYAAARHIDIIPEIDMPGHMMSAITAYPFLTCNGENKWGTLFTKPICPCNESTFVFAQNVFTAIMDIFPSKYIHIGGDEVDRSDWAKSAACKALMAREGIKDLPGLQTYFIDRMEKFFNAHGRRLIGWDEIIEGGVSSSAIVMYWRTWVHDAPVKAVENGNQVIMAPGEPLYFDNQPDQYSVSKVYHFDPVPKGITPEQARLIIGAQACTWSENIPSENRADYMIMPRMIALAENLWTHQSQDYRSFNQRLDAQFTRLDYLKVHYRLPDLPDMITDNVFTDADTLRVEKPLAGMQIHYTTDGSLPAANSTELSGPLIIRQPLTIKLAAFTPNGLRGDIYTLNYKKEDYAPAATAETRAGLTCSYYKAFFKNTLAMAGKAADSTFTADSVVVPATVKAPSFGLQYRGYIDVPADGIYSFFLTCDDGGTLTVANKEVVNNDGLHSAIEKNGQIALRKGLQPLALDFIEGGGGFTLKLKYSVNGSAPQAVPAAWLRH